MHAWRVEDPLDRSAADLALGDGPVTHPLHHVEDVALLALVLVDRHQAEQYRGHPRSLALSPRECQAGCGRHARRWGTILGAGSPAGVWTRIGGSGGTNILCGSVKSGCGEGPEGSIEAPERVRRAAVKKFLDG